ncbi:MAG: NAD(P)/FAD-dependent oxidoreductase [Candidatus Micrarchaeota archaeon]|nr:NAD(P)/FAD-dependent oxidoreductase [Candidatus Micrarchaeota archaeon]
MIRIAGAGLAGLCAAINLARQGEKVAVFEKQKEVGARFPPNLQGMKYVDSLEKFLMQVGVESKVKPRTFSRFFFCTRKRDLELGSGNYKKMSFVVRGGRDSLEYALYREAERLGVSFEFSALSAKQGANIVATGASECHFAAAGMILEDSDFPRDHFLVMFDDRYSPKGWYCYIFPVGKDEIEFVNCASQPYVPMLSQLTKKAIAERKILRQFLEGKRVVRQFGGSGAASFPPLIFSGGRYYVGEAAGFQDPFMGFGMKYALLSGKLAADDILKRGSYEKGWKELILPDMRKDIARRFLLSILGDAVVEFFMRRYQSGDEVDLSHAAPENFPFYSAVEWAFFQLEVAKKRLGGNW